MEMLTEHLGRGCVKWKWVSSCAHLGAHNQECSLVQLVRGWGKAVVEREDPQD